MLKYYWPALCLIAVFLTPGISQAADLPGGFFYDQPTCFERTYTRDHLRKHPNQRVSRIRFEHFPHIWGLTRDDGRTVDPRLSPGRVHFRVLVAMRGKPRLYDNTGECYAEGGRLNCYVECDGGGFEIIRDGKNKMLIKNRGFSVSGCGSSDAEDLAWVNAMPDDKVFRVYRLPALDCMQPLAASGQ